MWQVKNLNKQIKEVKVEQVIGFAQVNYININNHIVIVIYIHKLH